jgi:hypothetical protein
MMDFQTPEAPQRLVSTVVRLQPMDRCANRPTRDAVRHATGVADVPGLIRRYFLGDGGLYLWTDRSAAERFHTHEWRRGLARQFGLRAEVLFIERAVES